MFTHGKACRIFLDGFDVSAFFNSVTCTGTADIAETSTYTATSKSYVLGLQDNTLSASGFYSSPTGELPDRFNAALGSAVKSIWTIYPQGDAIGLDGWGFNASQTSFTVDSNMGGATSITGEAQSSVGAELIKSHHALGPETAPGNSVSIDSGVTSTTTGGVGYLHVTALTGADITVNISDSADNITFPDLLTFAQVTAANAKERKTLAAGATVLRYTRAEWVGTFTGATFVVGFGRNPKGI